MRKAKKMTASAAAIVMRATNPLKMMRAASRILLAVPAKCRQSGGDDRLAHVWMTFDSNQRAGGDQDKRMNLGLEDQVYRFAEFVEIDCHHLPAIFLLNKAMMTGSSL